MRRVQFALLCLICLFGVSAEAASRIVKVLPHYIDAKGRHALSPSLFERDAYQAYLREHPLERKALRFNVQWKSSLAKSKPLKIRVEARGAKGNSIHTVTLESDATRNGWITSWTPLSLAGQQYVDFGDLVAWRATLWDGDQMIAEQKSFIW